MRILVGIAMVLGLTLAGCATDSSGQRPTTTDPIASPLVASPRPISNSGGRLDWFHGSAHDLIVFDAPVAAGRTEVFTMAPDGSNRRCVTCDIAALPRGFIGQPAWHPDGEHIVIQAEGTHSRGSLFNHMAWGVNNDLWLVNTVTDSAERIWQSAENHGALHPHFDRDGGQLVFAERIATGDVVAPRAARFGAGGENQWTGWRIHLADVDLDASGAVLSNHRRLFEDAPGFYETHGFGPEGELVFSHTANGRRYVDEIFSARPAGGIWTPLIASPSTWDEHGAFSPSGRSLAFVSSRADPSWQAPGSTPETLRTELFLQTADGRIHQLTRFNETSAERFLVSDFDWDRDGRRIAFQLAPMTGDWRSPAPPEIWLLTFDQPQ